MELENQNEEKREQPLEELFDELDQVLHQMEDGEVPLEEAFSLYEKGMRLVKECSGRLDLVEKRMLEIAKDGSLQPFGEE